MGDKNAAFDALGLGDTEANALLRRVMRVIRKDLEMIDRPDVMTSLDESRMLTGYAKVLIDLSREHRQAAAAMNLDDMDDAAIKELALKLMAAAPEGNSDE